MIIANERDVTAAVLAEAARTPDARTREILQAGIAHLHAFVRDARLSENEFRQLVMRIARLGQMTDASHNEVMVAAGSLGVSALVCLLNNDADGSGTTANLMGPFWRAGAPHTPSGGSIVRSPTAGDPVFVTGVGARPRAVSRCQAPKSTCGTRRPRASTRTRIRLQADMNLRGRFVTDANGCFAFRTVKPAGYPVPVHGPVGDLLRAQGRHNMRPAHLHFLIHKPGYKTQFSQVYSADDPHLETDSQFGVTRALVAHYERHDDAGSAPAGDVTGPWYTLQRRFVIDAGDAQLPRPPISGRNAGPRPELTVLRRRP